MRIVTLLNKFYPLKSFVYVKDQLEKIEYSESYVVDIIPLKNGIVKCSICSLACSICDNNNPSRLFEFVPLWGMKVYLRYFMRRVSCATCGVRAEKRAWGEGENLLTIGYQIFLAQWGRRLSWEVASRLVKMEFP